MLEDESKAEILKSDEMTVREIIDIIYTVFYVCSSGLAIFTGIKTGFRGNSHTAPLPFLVELLALPVGFLLRFIDSILLRPATAKKMRVHIWGLTVNGSILVIIIWLALRG